MENLTPPLIIGEQTKHLQKYKCSLIALHLIVRESAGIMAHVGNACVSSSKTCNQVLEIFLSHGNLHVKVCKMNQGGNGKS